MASAGKKKWSDNEVKTLIMLYEQCPSLWDVKCNQYKNRKKKLENLEQIATRFETTQLEVSRKLHNLRSQFMQELRKIKLKKRDADVDEICVSSWPYFNALKFIQSSAEGEASTSNSKFTEENKCEEKKVVGCPLESPTKKRNTKQNEITIIVEEDIQRVHKILQQPNDPEQIFGNYVASELRSLKKVESKRKLKHLINCAIKQISDADASDSDYL